MENNLLLKKYNFELECALRDYKIIDKKIDYLKKNADKYGQSLSEDFELQNLLDELNEINFEIEETRKKIQKLKQ
jgi:hypothetical protein